MSAAAFLAELTGRGVTLSAAPGGKLRYAPRDALAQEEIQKLKSYKQELLSLVVSKEDKSTVTAVTAVTTPTIPDTYGKKHGDGDGDGKPDGDTTAVTMPPFMRGRNAARPGLGLVSRWAREFGYVAVYDPTLGDWHELRTKDAPGWAVREARKRRELWKAGEPRAYELTAIEMQEIWEREQPAEGEEGIVEEYPVEEGAE